MITKKEPNARSESDALLDAVTDAALESLCVPRRLLGYGYLFVAVRYLASCPYYAHPSMLKDVYPHVARCAGTGRVMAERAIRYAIERAWRDAPETVRASYIGQCGAQLQAPPTNAEFIYMVAERVRLICGEIVKEMPA